MNLKKIETYQIENLYVGFKKEFYQTIDKLTLDLFTKLSGDENPLHTNPSFAKSYGYQDQVVHGLLTASMYSKLVGMHLPGKNALLQSLDVSFVKPVYLKDKLLVVGEVQSIDLMFRQIQIKGNIFCQNEKVSRASIKVGFLKKL